MNNNHINNSNGAPNANSPHWMMGTETYGNYMLSRPPGSVLPVQQVTRQDEQASTSSAEYDPPSNKSKSSRSVIPSKRAAQNRAAQKAFRQRREQYIKDLEIKAKEMEDWQTEMDNLRAENKELRERVVVLENQVNVLTGGDPTKLAELDPPENHSTTTTTIDDDPIIRTSERSMSLPITKKPEPADTIPKRPSLHESQEDIDESNRPFTPVPLRAPHQTGPSYINEEVAKRRKLEEQAIGQAPFHHNTTTHNNNNNNNNNKVNIIQQHQLQYPVFWDGQNNMPPETAPNTAEFELDFDFDPFFEDEFGPTLTNSNDFLPNANSNQVLDDLFAMLQTRQRPQIPMIPSEDDTTTTIGKMG